MVIINETKNTVLVKEAKFAKNFFERMLGLIPRKEISEEQALVFENCKQIHTFFMKFSIDVIYLNRDSKVIKLEESISPFRICRWVKDSKYIIEAKAGIIKNKNIEIGDKIKFIEE